MNWLRNGIFASLYMRLSGHSLLRFSDDDAVNYMRESFLKREITSGVFPRSFLSIGLYPPALSLFVTEWRYTLCDALVASRDEVVQRSLGQAQRKVSVIEGYLQNFHPGKQYEYVFTWQTVPQLLLSSKDLQHLHLLLAWGGRGLCIVTEDLHSASLWQIIRTMRGVESHAAVQLAERLARSGFTVEGLFPVIATCPRIKSSWLTICVWRIMSLFRYHVCMAPFVTHIGVRFKK